MEDPPTATTVLCDASALASDLETVDALARLQLGALRVGCRLRLLDPPAELCELLAFLGLGEVLPVESRRQPEEGEEMRRVEEERDSGDGPV